MSSGLHLTLLGTPAARFAGRPLDPPDGQGLPKKYLTLLCYLATERRPVPRSEVSDLFWPDRNEANLRVALSRLRAL